MRKVLAGDAGTVVAHGYLDVLALLHGAYLYFASAPAVFRRVVEYVQHHLLETARVAGDEGQAALRRGVLELYAVVAQQLAVCKAHLFEQGGHVYLLEVQREAAVAHARELQQLLDHAGEPARLAGDYLDAAAGVALERLVVEQGLAPAGDGRERGAQLVRDRGYELVLYAVCLANLHAHVVYCVGERAYLVVAQTLGKRTVAAVGDVPRGVAKAQYGARHALAEPEVAQQQYQYCGGREDAGPYYAPKEGAEQRKKDAKGADDADQQPDALQPTQALGAVLGEEPPYKAGLLVSGGRLRRGL